MHSFSDKLKTEKVSPSDTVFSLAVYEASRSPRNVNTPRWFSTDEEDIDFLEGTCDVLNIVSVKGGARTAAAAYCYQYIHLHRTHSH